LKTLQDVFGYINDARMAPKLAELCQQGGANTLAERATGYAAGYHEARAAHVWRDADGAWRGFKRAKRFWD
jgi:hypothetical protein